MKYAFLLLLAGISCAFADEPLKVEQSLPHEAPVSVVVLAQCNHAIGVYATMKDGTLLAFDMSSHVSFKDQTDWASQAKRIITVQAKCIVAPGAITSGEAETL